eukprot:c39780_g1_i1.p1 GENE.c39780_g1_i1~~c39780_g1_i1.p1  ORF type:complete len:316 (-),score=49.35 c39780_g1_i1:151-1098(-)
MGGHHKMNHSEIALALAMAYHPRLGANAPCKCLPPDIIINIVSMLPVVVPDHVSTLGEALAARRGDNQGQAPLHIIVRQGEYIVGAIANDGKPRQAGWETRIQIRNSNVHIHGEPGTVLKGMLEFLPGSFGTIQNVNLVDGGDCCVRASGGTWEIRDCKITCAHASAVRAEDSARVSISNCTLGGIGIGTTTTISLAYGAIQEYNITQNSCYGVFASGDSCVEVENSAISYCSQASVFLRDNACVSLKATSISHTASALLSGVGCGRSLRAHMAHVTCARSVWYDEDRPHSLEWSDCVIGAERCAACTSHLGFAM